MLTYTYIPDQKKIEERKKIEIFGTTAISSLKTQLSTKLPSPKFHRSDQPQEAAISYKYTPVYKPKSDYTVLHKVPFTLHVYNIPRDATKRDFLEMVALRIEDPVFHCNFVFDRERKTFLGVAYLRFRDEVSGRKAMRALDGMQMGDLLVGVNVAKKQY